MGEEKTSLGPWLYWSLVTIATLSYGLINLPYFATRVMGPNSYLAVPIAMVFAFPPLIAIYLLMKRYPTLNLLQAGLKITGPIFGRLFGLGFLITLLIILVLFTRERVNLVKDYLIGGTPLLVIAATYLFSAAYLASRGIETISRLASFVIIPVLSVLFLLMVGVLPDISINRLRPVFHPDLKLYFPGGLSVAYAYYPLVVFGLITPYLRGMRRKIPRFTLGALLVLVFVYMLFMIGVIGTFGCEYGRRHSFPALEVIRAMEFPYLLLEQAGLFMIIVWITIGLVGSGFFYYAVALGFSQILGILDYKRMVWFLVPVNLFLIMYPENTVETKEFIAYVVDYGWISLFGLPILYYLCALVFRKGVGRR